VKFCPECETEWRGAEDDLCWLCEKPGVPGWVRPGLTNPHTWQPTSEGDPFRHEGATA
jgi:predicted amidophosphoribosyltransferase